MGNDTNIPTGSVNPSTIYYAVKNEKRNLGIFHRWEEFQKNAVGQPGLHMRSFETLFAAQQWFRKSQATPRKRKRPISRTPTSGARIGRVVVGLSDDEIDESSDDKEDTADERTVLPSFLTEPPETPSTQLPSQSPPLDSPFRLPTPSVVIPPPSPAANIVTVPDLGDLGGYSNLSSEQKAVLSKVVAGQSIFFTGAAGTGKSFLLREIVSWARSTYGTDKVAITASTGLAAVNIGGCTLYSWAGIGLGKKPPEALLRIINNASWGENERTKKRFIRPNSPLRRWLDSGKSAFYWKCVYYGAEPDVGLDRPSS
ncbi:PIF1-like helicase-domain-containing protein [Irpex rosettiformis]|uniref:PIF1-like helicase-domain-containing protein n=1 Tax=Irpex rosettiformis TaxID=378272 RepID=A0ACB8TUH0_9APHY|nr:PIF1-like helicase-domain-containing protein [Irpex rosettiformis]